MLRQIAFLETEGTDPYRNLALEETLRRSVSPGEAILYLWQNARTVVIGRNQNPWAECRVADLEKDGGCVARRLTGGGAVFHDLGNLNFSFLTREEDFDIEKQTEVILEAVRSAGIPAEKNGRNDLTVEGRKFSGHAYYETRGQCLHHGTLMLGVNEELLSRYLTVSPEKLRSKGVASVRSRVINLLELAPDLTPALMKEKLKAAFSSVYRLPLKALGLGDLDPAVLKEEEERFSSREWIFNRAESLPLTAEKRGISGLLRVDFSLRREAEVPVLSEIQVTTDALEADFYAEVQRRLTGAPLIRQELQRRLMDGAKDPARAALLSEELISLLLPEETPQHMEWKGMEISDEI